MWPWPLKMPTQNFLILLGLLMLMQRNVLTTVETRFWSWSLVEILNLNYDVILVKELNPRVRCAVGNVCLVFWDEKTGIVEWAISHTSSIAAHMIGPAILIHITIFAQHTLINVVLVIWLQSIGRKNTKCVLCGNLSNWISQTLLKSICFFDPLATGDQSSKVEIWNGCIRTWVEGCLHKVHYLLLSQLFCFFSSQSLKPFFESSLNQLKDQWICETTLKRAVETNACNVSIFLSIAFQPV